MATFTGFDGTDMYYVEEGVGSPVVLLHGLSVDTAQNWMSPGIWSRLVEAGHRVVGFDARGHGRSGKPHDPSAYEHDAMVKDVSACFDRLGLAEADLAGYSMGASTALQFAARDDPRPPAGAGRDRRRPQAVGRRGRSACRHAEAVARRDRGRRPGRARGPCGADSPEGLRGARQRPRRDRRLTARRPPSSVAGYGVGGGRVPDFGGVRESGRLADGAGGGAAQRGGPGGGGRSRDAVRNPELAKAMVRFLVD